MFGAVFAEIFSRTIRDLPKKPVFEKKDANWIDVLLPTKKQYNTRVLTSSKLTSTRAFLKKNAGYVYKLLLDKRKKNQ